MNTVIRRLRPVLRRIFVRGVVGAAASCARGWPPLSLAPGASPKAAAPLRSATALQDLAEHGRRFRHLALALFPLTLLAEPSSGGRFSLDGGPVTGGGQSAGGAFAVAGGAGETATGGLSGGTFTVTGGLIGVAVVPGDVVLDFTNTDGQVTLTWPADASGYVLQFTPVIGDASNWQPVTPAPAAHTFML